MDWNWKEESPFKWERSVVVLSFFLAQVMSQLSLWVRITQESKIRDIVGVCCRQPGEEEKVLPEEHFPWRIGKKAGSQATVLEKQILCCSCIFLEGSHER